MYHQVAPKLDKSLYPQYSTVHDKENTYEGASFGDMTMPPYHEVDYGYKAPLKRGLMESVSNVQSNLPYYIADTRLITGPIESKWKEAENH